MKSGDTEMIQRLLAEAIHQLGGVLKVNMADLGEHRGRVDVTTDGNVLTCRFSGKAGMS